MEFCQNKKGLTLIEVLISITIIMILFSSFFYIWNTLDIFRTARDNKRINDLNLLDSAIKTILATNPDLNLGQENIIYISLPDSSSTCGSYNLIPIYFPFSYRCQNKDNYLKIDGNGWIPIDFRLGQVLGLSSLPIDPLNNKDYFYAYQVKGNRYKLTAKFESKRYISKMVNDGGFEPTLYEVGSNLQIPSPHSGLVAYWSFDETGTTAIDYSGYSNNGTIAGTSVVNGKIGKARQFPGGTTDQITGSSTILNLTGPLTITVWIYPQGTPSGCGTYARGGIFGRGGWDLNVGYELLFSYENKIEFNINQGGPSTPSLSLNQWYFIGSVFDGLTSNIYINGNLVSSASENNPISNNRNFYIGKRDPGNLYACTFNGIIDEMRIYNRPLSTDEIKALYDATK